MIDGLQRHDLLRVDPAGWRRALEHIPDVASRPWVSGWAERGWPVIVRRYQREDAADLIPVAVCLPPACARPGRALQLKSEDVRERLPPVDLSACADAAPLHWRDTLRSLLAIGDQIQVRPSVFGSLLWQTLTGLNFLSADSDLDLIWRVARPQQALSLARSLAACTEASPMRIDGEFMLPSGAAVHWREWLDEPEEVIVKSMRRVDRCARERVFA
jgi:phosphoribosyl-dephospho-CoA transferase